MKKVRIITILFALAMLFAVGCEKVETPDKQDITGVTFTSASFDYDGNEKSLTILGSLPTGATVTYTSSKATNAGVYTATATIIGANYNTLTLDAMLTINKIDITGITFTSAEVAYTGKEQAIVVSGEIPAGVQVTYVQNKGTNIGSYNATATLVGTNYNELKLTATLKIEQNLELYLDIAQNMLSYLFEKPDPYAFLPNSLKLENKSILA